MPKKKGKGRHRASRRRGAGLPQGAQDGAGDDQGHVGGVGHGQGRGAGPLAAQGGGPVGGDGHGQGGGADHPLAVQGGVSVAGDQGRGAGLHQGAQGVAGDQGLHQGALGEPNGHGGVLPHGAAGRGRGMGPGPGAGEETKDLRLHNKGWKKHLGHNTSGPKGGNGRELRGEGDPEERKPPPLLAGNAPPSDRGRLDLRADAPLCLTRSSDSPPSSMTQHSPLAAATDSGAPKIRGGFSQEKKKKKEEHYINPAVATVSGAPKVQSDERFVTLYSEDISFTSCGLMNTQRTCYMNVILQSLMHMKPLLAYLLSETFGRECGSHEDDWCLLCALRKHAFIARGISSQGPYSFQPAEIINHLNIIAGPNFVLGTDQDASEFMGHVVRKMQSDFLIKHNYNNVGPSGTIIHHMFGGEIISELVCIACERSSPKYELIQDISVEVGDSDESLMNCLKLFTQGEILEDVDCTRCKGKQKAYKSLFINEAPNILTITLKRFRPGKKLETHISFPMELEMTQFMHRNHGDNIYDLCGVVIHVGSGLCSGHYMCYSKNYLGKWSLFDDARVNPVPDVKEIQEKKAYMLFYIRRTVRPKRLPLDVSMEHKEGIQPMSFPPHGKESMVQSDERFVTLYSEDISFTSCGLMNTQRTCYMNVILQSLMHMKPLLAYLLSETFGRECGSHEDDWCLLCALRKHAFIARGISSQGPYSFQPVEIINHLNIIAGPNFVLGTDQDASEFMGHVVRKMQSDFLIKHNYNNVGPSGTIIHHMFGGEIISELVCIACERSSPKYELIQDISVEVGDSDESLMNCLKLFTQGEILEDVDCTRCKGKQKAYKSLFINEAPNILTITLKRFRPGKKLETHISFPMELEMTQFMHRNHGDNIYDLCGVVIHVGSGLCSGHYMCYSKNYLGKWSLFDDARVNPVPDVKEIQEKKAYMLFYIRRTVRPKRLPLDVSMEHKEGIQPMSFPPHDDAVSPSLLTTQIDDKQKKEESLITAHVDDESLMASFRRKLFNTAAPTTIQYQPKRPTTILYQPKRSLDNVDLKQTERDKLRKIYWIAEDTEKEIVLANIKRALKHYEETGHFSLPKCGQGSTVYDEGMQQILMVNKGEYQSRSTIKEKRIAKVMTTVKDHLESDTLIQLRTILYMNKRLFNLKQSNSDDIVNAVCNILRCTRSSLNVTVSSSGSIIGPILLRIKRKIFVNCWECGAAGNKIPDEANHLIAIECFKTVRFILVVEKETIFRILTGLDLHRKYRCVIITGCGQPDQATRCVVSILSRTLEVPVYGFVDPNPYGASILHTYKFGSGRKAFDNLGLPVPDLIWIGLHSKDFPPIDDAEWLSEPEQNLLTGLLSLPHIQGNAVWMSRLTHMTYTGITGDIEQYLGYNDIEDYLCRNIPQMQATKAKRKRRSEKKEQVDRTDEKKGSPSENKPDVRNTRKRKLDAVDQDAASPMNEIPVIEASVPEEPNLKRKSKKTKRTLEGVSESEVPEEDADFERKSSNQKNRRRTQKLPVIESSVPEEEPHFKRKSKKKRTLEGLATKAKRKCRSEKKDQVDRTDEKKGSPNENKPDVRNTRKRKLDAVDQDAASPMNEIPVIEASVPEEPNLKRKSKKTKRTLEGVSESEVPEEEADFERKSSNQKNRRRTQKLPVIESSVPEEEPHFKRKSKKKKRTLEGLGKKDDMEAR